MKRKSTVNRLYTRPVFTKAVRVPNELSFEEPVNPLLKHPLKQGQPDQTPLKSRNAQSKGSEGVENQKRESKVKESKEKESKEKETNHGV